MFTTSQQDVSVRPELESMTAYLPGESLVAFSARTGIPVHRITKLNSNESPYGPVPSAIEALGDCKNYNNYPDTDATILRAAISDYTGLERSHIVLSHGSNELINLLWHIFLAVGDTITCCPPTFSLYSTVTSFCGASVIEVPRTSEFEVNVVDVLAALTPTTKLIVICSPNNPTGNPIAESDVLALLESGRIVVIDEAYVEFSQRPGGFAYLVPHYRNLVVLRSFSKWAGLAGLRIGYGLFPIWIANYMLQAQCPFEVNVAGHIAAIETLAHLDQVLANVQRISHERERLFNMLKSQSYLTPFPSQGNYILARLDDVNVKIEQLRSTVERYGILLRYFQKPSMQNFLRVTVGLPEHTDLLAQALAKVGSEGTR
jgi:histidinol-phosphate aminotransferase